MKRNQKTHVRIRTAFCLFKSSTYMQIDNKKAEQFSPFRFLILIMYIRFYCFLKSGSTYSLLSPRIFFTWLISRNDVPLPTPKLPLRYEM